MSKRKVSVEDKIYAVNLYLDGKESQHRIAAIFDVCIASVQQWIRNYESMGADAFTLKGNKKYSKELKQQAVLDYLAGRGSQDDICKRYGIRSKAKLQIWIKKYNGHEELKSSGTGGNTIMTKGRKTTFEERVEIVQYCIAHGRNYTETAKQYQVSYQQANIYTRQSKKNTKNMTILLLTFADSAECPELLTINGYIEKFLRVNNKTGELQMRLKRFIQNHQIKDIEESEMTWNVIMTLM